MLNKKLLMEMKGLELELDQFTGWVEDRYYWARMLSHLRQMLLDVEASQEAVLKAKTGIWIEKFVPIGPAGPVLNGPGFNPEVPRQLCGTPAAAQPRRKGQLPAASAPSQPAATAAATDITGVILTCRSVNMSSVSSKAYSELAYALETQLKSSTNYFDPAGTSFSGAVLPDASDLTFSFEMTVKLKRPLKL